MPKNLSGFFYFKFKMFSRPSFTWSTESAAPYMTLPSVILWGMSLLLAYSQGKLVGADLLLELFQQCRVRQGLFQCVIFTRRCVNPRNNLPYPTK